MKCKLFLISFSCFLTSCESHPVYSPFDNVAVENAQAAKLVMFGHTNKLPINALIKLSAIDGKTAWNESVVGYELQPKKYTLKYQYVFITGSLTFSTIHTLLRPYIIEANLEANYVYMPIIEKEGEIYEKICLYGEPIGVKGQNLYSPVVLSESAKVIACGGMDNSDLYAE